MSIPVVFEPVRIGESLLVDGGVVDPVPVDAARDLVDGPVIAVDVGPLQPPIESQGASSGTKPVLRVGRSDDRPGGDARLRRRRALAVALGAEGRRGA